MDDLGAIRAQANRDALEVINMARDPDRGLPAVQIATNDPDGLIAGETGFNAAWARSSEDWSADVWDAYRDTFEVECGKANIGLIHSELYREGPLRGHDSVFVASIHAVDLERWRLKDGQRMKPGVLAGGVGTDRLPGLFESTKPTLRERLRRRR